MAMPLRISPTVSSLRLPKMESRRRHFAVFRAREPLACATKATSSSSGAPVSVGREALVVEAGDYRAFFGWRSDSFFFDANGLFNNMQFTGDDFFADKDVCSIVLELPNAALGGNEVGLWGRTLDKTERRLDSGRSGRKARASGFPSRRGAGVVPQGGAGGR